MALSYKILDFPNLPIKAQLFHVPGAALDGGYTSGGARIMSPEPGGRSMLELQLSLHTNEWGNPALSWLMSKINGEIFRVLLTKTPQLLNNFGRNVQLRNLVPWERIGIVNSSPWDNGQLWLADGETASSVGSALEGTTVLQIALGEYAGLLMRGHVIGLKNSAYMIDEIEYNDDQDIATVTITPPLRNNIAANEDVYFRPYFLGTIANGEEFRQTYDIVNVGHLQPGRLLLKEAIVS